MLLYEQCVPENHLNEEFYVTLVLSKYFFCINPVYVIIHLYQLYLPVFMSSKCPYCSKRADSNKTVLFRICNVTLSRRIKSVHVVMKKMLHVKCSQVCFKFY